MAPQVMDRGRVSRRRAIIGIAATSLFLGAACRPQSVPGRAPTSTEGAGSSRGIAPDVAGATPAATRFPTSSGPVSISYFNWFSPADPQNVVLPQARKRFVQTFPHVTIQNQFASGTTQLQAKLETMVAAGTPPDTSALNPQIITPLYSKGLLMDLTTLIKQDAATWKPEDFFPATLTRVIKDGKQYAVPLQIGLYVMIVNLDLFKRAGVSLPTDRWTWETEFVAACQQLTRAPSRGSKQFGTILPPIEIPIWANGGDLLSADGTRCLLDQPAAYEAIQWMSDLRFKDKVAPLQGDLEGLNPLKMFMTGRLGINIDITGSVSQIERQKPPFNWDLFIVPRGKVTRATIVQGPSLAVFNASRHHDLAWDWVELYTGPEIQMFAATQARVVSARQSAARAYVALPAPPEHRAPLVDSVAFARQRLFLANWAQVNDTISKNLDDVLTSNKITPRQATAAACQQLQSLLGKPTA